MYICMYINDIYIYKNNFYELHHFIYTLMGIFVKL